MGSERGEARFVMRSEAVSVSKRNKDLKLVKR